MRYGSEVKVGLITLLVAALIITFAVYVRGFRAGAETYTLKVFFDNARGLQSGDAVRMVGVKIGEVDSVSIGRRRKAVEARGGPSEESAAAVVVLKINRDVLIPNHYTFRIGTSGLIQERFVEVIPAGYSPEARSLRDGDEVEGELSPDLSDLVASGVEVLGSLQKTSRLLRSVLSDEEAIQAVKEALSKFATSATAATKLAESVSALSEESRPELAATLKRLRQAADGLGETASALQARLGKTSTFDDLEAAAREASQAAAKANTLISGLSDLGDPEVRRQIRETVSAAHDAAESVRTFAEELRKAAPAVPKVAQEAESIAQYSSGVRERLKPPEISARFDVLYSGEAGRSFSSGVLDFKTTQDHFLRVGIDDIGEGSTANIQIAEKQRRGVLRYGLVRSRLGLGLDYPLPHQGTISLDLFDPNNVRADILADIPLMFGTQELGLAAGLRDVGEEALFVAGVSVRR